MGQDHVLLVRDAQGVIAKAGSKIGQKAHLRDCRIPGGLAVGFQRDRHDGMISAFMAHKVGIGPSAKHGVSGISCVIGHEGCCAKSRRCKLGADISQKGLINAAKRWADQRKTLLHKAGYFRKAMFMDCDFDARFIFVVAPSESIPNGDHSLKVRQEISFGQEVLDNLSNHRGATEAAADQDLIPKCAVTGNNAQPYVVRGGHCAVIGAACHSDFELARQELKLWVVGAPLADQFGDGARVGQLICGRTCEVVSGHVTDGVA